MERQRWNAASFTIIISCFTFVLCDVGYFFVAQSHSVDVIRWSAVVISSPSRYSAVFCCFDQCFVDLAATLCHFFCLFFNKFEEFVDVIFPSLLWSSNRSVGPVV